MLGCYVLQYIAVEISNNDNINNLNSDMRRLIPCLVVMSYIAVVTSNNNSINKINTDNNVVHYK